MVEQMAHIESSGDSDKARRQRIGSGFKPRVPEGRHQSEALSPLQQQFLRAIENGLEVDYTKIQNELEHSKFSSTLLGLLFAIRQQGKNLPEWADDMPGFKRQDKRQEQLASQVGKLFEGGTIKIFNNMLDAKRKARGQ